LTKQQPTFQHANHFNVFYTIPHTFVHTPAATWQPDVHVAAICDSPLPHVTTSVYQNQIGNAGMTRMKMLTGELSRRRLEM
jgi:hypothetical protein